MAAGRRWYRLDNAAKIIPSTAHGYDTRVFRISCTMTEEVDPACLQEALDRTILDFPHFNCVLRKGFFWFYMETTPARVLVEEEFEAPMRSLYQPGKAGILYRVLYYRKRITVEIFHAVTDGTGGMVFMKALLRAYISIRHHLPDLKVSDDSTGLTERAEDAFRRFYSPKAKNWLKNLVPRLACQLKGAKAENFEMILVEGQVPLDQYRALAAEKNTSLMILTVAIYIQSIMKLSARSELKRPIVIQIPVNLRNYFDTETTRNFFGTINIEYMPDKDDGSIDSIIRKVSEEFSKKLNADAVSSMMDTYATLEHNMAVKVVPLFLKDLGIQGIYFLNRLGITSCVSNMGKIEVAPEMEPYIENFSCFSPTLKTQMVFSSYKNILTFGFATVFRNHVQMMHFFRTMTSYGIDVTVSTTDYYEQTDR